MKKLIILLALCFCCSGCSLVKWAVTPFQNKVSNVPQSIIKGKNIIKCKGDLTILPDGSIKCSKGYYAFNEDSNTQERRTTLKEKIIQFFNSLMGWGFWGVIALVILCPSLLGLIAGRIFEGIYGMGNKAFKQVSTAIQKVKDQSPELITALEKSTDEDVRKWIDEFKKKNRIK
jgi:hypothetical protein